MLFANLPGGRKAAKPFKPQLKGRKPRGPREATNPARRHQRALQLGGPGKGQASERVGARDASGRDSPWPTAATSPRHGPRRTELERATWTRAGAAALARRSGEIWGSLGRFPSSFAGALLNCRHRPQLCTAGLEEAWAPPRDGPAPSSASASASRAAQWAPPRAPPLGRGGGAERSPTSESHAHCRTPGRWGGRSWGPLLIDFAIKQVPWGPFLNSTFGIALL